MPDTHALKAGSVAPDASAALHLFTAAERKRIETARANAALLGIVLIVIEDDRGRPEILCSRWALTKTFGDDIGAAEAWLARVAGRVQ